ncbi:MAG: CDP-alcohol phosphatidyltransferase family protein [Rickettsiales bacterium]|jgi:CDP-diacylglycerol--glycerol-3-phosphate 3-phosphatidyltransferase|nr:CDP-alcohol phosphatidyltransferase family protein [Rickettsiales bacterium]
MKKLPNILTIFRLFAAFAVVPAMLWQWYWVALVLFALGGISDFVDGWLSRKYKLETKFGKIMDSIADKMLVANGLLLMTLFLQIWLVIVPAVLLICREFYVSGLREFGNANKIELHDKSHGYFSICKVKLFCQTFSLGLMFLWIACINAGIYNIFMTKWLLFLAIGVLWLAVITSLWSAFNYTREFTAKTKKLK